METPKSSVMRFENSAEISSSRLAGTSPVLKPEIVGSDNSSATQGSSVVSIAGKKRLPAKQCAAAGDASNRAKASVANTAAMLACLLGWVTPPCKAWRDWVADMVRSSSENRKTIASDERGWTSWACLRIRRRRLSDERDRPFDRRQHARA